MNNVKRNKIKRFSVKITLLLALLICSQYIFTGIYIGKEIAGTIKKRNINYFCCKYR